ncbi:MAG: nuclear transport factor 2 family protein [Planctomycetota bacterium]
MTQPESAPEPGAPDPAQIGGLMQSLYDVISGPAGQARDWTRFEGLFHPGGAWLMVVGRPGGGEARLARRLTPADYRAAAEPMFQASGFHERELSRRVECYGHIAQVFSTYETRHEATGPVFDRGINSLQLVWEDGRWYVLSILWQGESIGPALPARYLQAPPPG